MSEVPNGGGQPKSDVPPSGRAGLDKPQLQPKKLTPQDTLPSLRAEQREPLSPNEELCAWYGTLRFLRDVGYHGSADEAGLKAFEMEAIADAALLGAKQGIGTRFLQRTEQMLAETEGSDDYNVRHSREFALARKLLAEAHLRTLDQVPSTEGLSWFEEAGGENVRAQVLIVQLREHNNRRLFERFSPELQEQIEALDPRGSSFGLKFENPWRIASTADSLGVASAEPMVDTLVDKLLVQTNTQEFSNTVLDEDVLGTLLTIGEHAAGHGRRDRLMAMATAVEKIVDRCHNLGGLGGMSLMIPPQVYTRLAGLYEHLGKPEIAAQKRELAKQTFESGLSLDPGWLPSGRAVNLLQFIEQGVFQQAHVDARGHVDVKPPTTELETTTGKLAVIEAVGRVVSNFDQFHDPVGYERTGHVPNESIRESRIEVYARAGVMLLKLAPYASGADQTKALNAAYELLTRAAEASFHDGKISSDKLSEPFFKELLIPLIDVVRANSDYSWRTVFSRLQFDKLPQPMQDMIHAAYEIRAYRNTERAQELLMGAGETMGTEMRDKIDMGDGYGAAHGSSPDITVWGDVAGDLLRTRKAS